MQAKPHIVAAENIYGDIAKQIGGEHVQVSSILDSPSQDPHLFSITPTAAKKAYKANVIILNGGSYDLWMETLLKTANKEITIIDVSKLIHAKPGDNPHYWYNPATMPKVAHSLTNTLSKIDASKSEIYKKNLSLFLNEYQKLENKIATMRKQFKGTIIISTEPVFNDMAQAIGLTVKGQAIQLSNMNDTSPSISAIKAFEEDLTQKRVKLFIFNKQVNNPTTRRFLSIAKKHNIPTVSVSELLPANQTYIKWMLAQLNQIEVKLKHD